MCDHTWLHVAVLQLSMVEDNETVRMKIFRKKGCGQVGYHVSTARIPCACMYMPMASSSSTCITSSEGPEALISIRSRFSRNQLASWMHRGHRCQQIFVESEKYGVYQRFWLFLLDSYNICPLANRWSIFGVKMKRNWSKYQHNYHNVWA